MTDEGYVVGAITSFVSNSDLNAAAYYDRMDLLHAWLTWESMVTDLLMQVFLFLTLLLGHDIAK